jgi:hypothetical protein
MTKEQKLGELLREAGLYVNTHEPERLNDLWTICSKAWWYRIILDNSNRAKAKKVSFDDLADAYDKVQNFIERGEHEESK